MALRRDLTYPGRYSSATSAQPQGAFLNRSTPTSNDGSYPEQQWQNDWSALFSSLLVNAGITPNNAVDSVGDSQYFDALMKLISRPNVLINSDLTFANAINQRAVANWGAVALNDYGLDRWKKVDTSSIIQPIEQGNFIPNETYTLSWNNGSDSRVIVAPTSGNWENSDLEIPITATGATKLEIGKNRTAWNPEKRSELMNSCFRYFFATSCFLSSSATIYNGNIYNMFSFPVRMRTTPALTGFSVQALRPTEGTIVSPANWVDLTSSLVQTITDSSIVCTLNVAAVRGLYQITIASPNLKADAEI